MANPTTYFGWVMPTSTDLVTDLPADFAVFGQGVDTSMQSLLGGTTGQVLSKTSNTNMAFTWVAQDDSNAIQNAIVDAKGDLIGATAADTPARLAVGTNGQFLTADSTAATGLAWASAGGSMTQIATGTLSGATGGTLTGIAGTYKDLVLQLDNVQVSAIVGLRIGVNTNTSGIYDLLTYEGRDGATRATYGTGETVLEYTYYRPVTGNNGNYIRIEFPNYASSTAYKTLLVTGAVNGAAGSGTGAGLPVLINSESVARTLTAITTINLSLSSGTYQGGTYTLFGVN